MKVTSGSTPAIAREVDALYAGLSSPQARHKEHSIHQKLAEAAKVIEKHPAGSLTLLFMNELAMYLRAVG